jgi:HlyD family secretion protein
MPKYQFITAGLVISIASLILYVFFSDADSDAPRYRMAIVSRGPIAKTVSASGTLKAIVTVEVGTQVSGLIKVLHADFNSEVEAGQVIARIDSALFEVMLSQAQAELAVVRASVAIQEATLNERQAELAGYRAVLSKEKKELARKRSLLSQKFVSSSEIDAAQANSEQAGAQVRAGLAGIAKQKAQIELAHAQVLKETAVVQQRKLDLEYTYIRSPVNGVVISRNVDIGQTIAASLKAPVLFQIAQDLTHMEVNINVDEADIGWVQVGQKVTFTVDSFPNRIFKGFVHQVRKAGEVVSNVVSYTVVANVDNADHSLLPGMTANVNIIVSDRNSALKIPNGALRLRLSDDKGMSPLTGSSWVWVMNDSGQPKRIPVVSGVSDGIDSEIVSGELKQGQKVIIGIAALASLESKQLQ